MYKLTCYRINAKKTHMNHLHRGEFNMYFDTLTQMIAFMNKSRGKLFFSEEHWDKKTREIVRKKFFSLAEKDMLKQLKNHS